MLGFQGHAGLPKPKSDKKARDWRFVRGEEAFNHPRLARVQGSHDGGVYSLSLQVEGSRCRAVLVIIVAICFCSLRCGVWALRFWTKDLRRLCLKLM